MSGDILEPRLTMEDVRVLRALPECVKPGRPLTLELDGLRFAADSFEWSQIRGLEHLGYARVHVSGRCGRTHKGDEYLAALNAPKPAPAQEPLT